MNGLWRATLAGAVTLSVCAASSQAAAAPGPAVMQPCDAMVTQECLVRDAKETLEASQIRGRLVFQNYCALCHGAEGRGDGRAARLHDPRPFNLTRSTAPRAYIAQVIYKGGEAMGRGKGMPPWGEQLTDEQMSDILGFLFSIRTNP